MTTEQLGPRTETFTCQECERTYGSQIAAIRCCYDIED